ncbi:MAG: hypothetical protein VX225_02510 [Pseudomonadota bacterium]|nr:hypothetical protein [Pseudomonadota bacterium]
MKLRIRGNSLRVRVSQAELTQITKYGYLEDILEFSPEDHLSYRLDVVPSGSVQASYKNHCIQISLPSHKVDQWNQVDQVSISFQLPLSKDKQLVVLVEKDFQCLNPREGDEDTDSFPNPGVKQ